MTRPFTGWHMLGILVAMFGVIIAVNLVMARAAIATFGGKVVENSYVASQKYNHWLAAARAQERLGWTHRITLDAGRHIVVELGDRQGPIGDARVIARITHPLGRLPARTLAVEPMGQGRYRSDAPLDAGRWQVHLAATRGKTRAVFEDEIAR